MSESFTVNLEGIDIAAESAGKGQNLILFLHGNCMSSNTWLPQLSDSTLTENFRLVAIDIPGHGQSSRFNNAVNYRIKNLADVVTRLVQEFKPSKLLLIGMSLGSNIIAEIKEPIKQCAGIMLVSPCILNDDHPVSRILMPDPKIHVIASDYPSEEDLRDYVYRNCRTDTIAEAYIKSYKDTDPLFRLELGKGIAENDFSDELTNIKNWNVPVCIAFGKEDKLLAIDYLNDFTHLWNDQVFVIEDAGHMLHEEQPDKFNDLLLRFATDVFK